MIVAGNGKNAATRRSAGEVGVLQDVHRTVDARSFAVPNTEYAVHRCTRKHPNLLASPERCRREVFVEARLETDVGALEMLPCRPEGGVVTAERRAAIARDEAAGIEPRRKVELPLHHRQPHERLDAGQIDAASIK